MEMIQTFTEYEIEAMRTAIYPRICRQQHSSVGVEASRLLPYEELLPVYPALAALGEAGELAAKITQEADTAPRIAFLKELGDVLWYITAAARDLDSKLEDLAAGYGPEITSYLCFVTTPERWDLERHVLRLVAVLGRFSERVKKSWRDGDPIAAKRESCLADLTQALGILAQLAVCFYSDLQEVATINIEKLRSRRERGVVGGSGDDR